MLITLHLFTREFFKKLFYKNKLSYWATRLETLPSSEPYGSCLLDRDSSSGTGNRVKRDKSRLADSVMQFSFFFQSSLKADF
jgi:hypothetical protein